MKRLKFKSEFGKSYKIPKILATQSICYRDVHVKSLIKRCSEIPKLLKKVYNFDSMLKKVMDTAAVTLLEHNIEMIWSNDSGYLSSKANKDLNFLDGEFKDAPPFRGLVLYDYAFKNPTSVMFNFASKISAVHVDSGLDDLYMKIPHELGHLIIVATHKSPEYLYMTPYDNKAEKLKFDSVVSQTLKGILQEFHMKTSSNDKTAISNVFCNKAAFISTKLLQQAQKKAGKGEHYIDQIDKREIVITLENAICNRQTEGWRDGEFIVRHFEQIANGLESNVGVKHEDLPYLQPLVEYTKDVLYPKFDQYIEEKCAESTAYTCEFDDNGLKTITLVAPKAYTEL